MGGFPSEWKLAVLNIFNCRGIKIALKIKTLTDGNIRITCHL